jgi:hypothetical protein
MEATLRPDFDAARAVASLRALCQQELHKELVEKPGWSPDEYEAWLFEMLKEQPLPREALYP